MAVILSLTAFSYAANGNAVKQGFTQIAELDPSDGSIGDGFGTTIAISDNTIAIGAPLENGYEGAVYVFVKPAGGWTNMVPTAKLTASNAGYGTFLGGALAITGDTIVAGGETPTTSGAYVFSKPASGWTDMTETAMLSDGNYGDSFGSSFAAVGSMIVVGARAAFDQEGAAYIFVKPAGGWQTTSSYLAQLRASDGQPGDLFGNALATDGGTILVGAAFATINGNPSQGKAYVFSEPQNGWSTTSVYTAELTASDGAKNNCFGEFLSISGKTIVIGDPFASPLKPSQGVAYVFVESADGWTTGTETAELTAPDGAGSGLGSSIATSGNMVIAGATRALSGEGAAYIFGEPNGGWVSTSHPNARINASDGAPNIYFGASAGIGEAVVVVGAPGVDETGSAYIFAR
jgi:hypothetical protein